MDKEAIKLQLTANYPHFNFNVDLCLPMTGITAIFGRSGSGKTTLLRCIAGLEKGARGRLNVAGEVWQSAQQFLAPHRRNIGYVFQESSLFEHLDVAANLEFGLRRVKRGASPAEYQEIVKLLGIEHLLGSAVTQLSGGERQRVAIVRALMLKPAILLLDEPLASLDRQRKQEILGYLEKLPAAFNIAIFYVSHSVEEVTRLADHLVVLQQGRVQFSGDIQQAMATREIQLSMQEEPFALLFGRVKSAQNQYGLTEVDVNGETFLMARQPVSNDQPIRLHLHAKDISLALVAPQQSSILNSFKCVIRHISEPTNDGQCMLRLSLAGSEVLARLSHYSCQQLSLSTGLEVFAQIKAVSVVQ
jgi:molybdate transport system ATP-binding protein